MGRCRSESRSIARNPSYAEASRRLEDLAELKVSVKQCKRIAIRIAIRIGSERRDEQQERIDAYTSASIRDQQHGQSDDAPANAWDNRVAVIQWDGGRVQVRDDYWGNEKPANKKHRWWRETQTAVLQTYRSTPGSEDPTPEVPECLKDSLWGVPKLNEIHRPHTPAGSAEEGEESSQVSPTEISKQTAEETKDDSVAGKKTILEATLERR
ncbi:hypothetical protein CA13_36210 [Planctomycetes bacterium CA13]|uniref:Uncharacterized protein n=1 Tax=Novipirellula herctigrandis TaxID=2527986 RepID=A0A5C5Z4P1_9BACT|nr:hypothetical protein CA13_36210 [Planctomycetes bacterium CA13]